MKKVNWLYIRAKYSFLFFDYLAWLTRVDTWDNLRKESKTNLKLIEIFTRKR